MRRWTSICATRPGENHQTGLYKMLSDWMQAQCVAFKEGNWLILIKLFCIFSTDRVAPEKRFPYRLPCFLKFSGFIY